MFKSEFDTLTIESIAKTDVGYMITDFKNEFEDKAEYEMFVGVLKESLGEFLMALYASHDENATIESLLHQLKKIIEHQFDELSQTPAAN